MDTLDLLLTRRSISAKDMGEPGPGDATLDRILADARQDRQHDRDGDDRGRRGPI